MGSNNKTTNSKCMGFFNEYIVTISFSTGELKEKKNCLGPIASLLIVWWFDTMSLLKPLSPFVTQIDK